MAPPPPKGPPQQQSRRKKPQKNKGGAAAGASKEDERMLHQGLDLFQKASRRKSRDLYLSAVECLRKAVDLASSDEELLDGRHVLGECMLEWSEHAANGDQEAFNLTKEAASCFDACLEAKATASAANNAGNCYASLAEMALRDRNDRQLSQQYSQNAESRYRLALQHNPQDVEIMSNLAREVSSRGIRTGDLSSFQAAHEIYNEAVQLMDQTQGDDLAGLLQDWGCMLQSMAEAFEQGGHSTVSIGSVGSDSEAMSVESIRAEAIEKLSHSTQFNSTTIAPRLALGDTLTQNSQYLYHHARYMDALSECDKALQTFGDILSIDANCQDAQIGHADAQMLKGRCLHSLGNAEEAALHWKRAAQVMMTCAVRRDADRSASDIRDLWYNAACCLSLAAEPGPAVEVLEKHVKPLSDDERDDPDFSNVRQFYTSTAMHSS